ncbi:MAG: hypothetical protein IPP72_15495 [Chitinophagaceae bacterium]|nr:hypothetical protein [Chitinophagaceae bacterium]
MIKCCTGNSRMVKRNQLTVKFAVVLYCMQLFCFKGSIQAQPKDSIVVQLNKNTMLQGDTLGIEMTLQDYAKVAKTATIQLWIENIKTGRRWKFRYPLINGYVNARLRVDSSMQDGLYAFNFLLQKTFFTLTGKAVNVTKEDMFLNYVMISKNKQTIVDIATLNDDSTFSIRNLLFKDSAFIIFAKPRQKKKNDLLVNIKTILDSAFVPAAAVTKFISIGKAINELQIKMPDTAAYIFNPDDTRYKILMPEVLVKNKSTKKLQDFANENTTGSFTGTDAIILDGLSSDEIANAPDLFTYLAIKVGGLRLETDNTTGNQSFTWRNQPVDMYINEIRLDPEIPMSINPSDIAMIKIFRPGNALGAGAGAGGAIAIYTKTGQYNKATNRNYSFYITGYTGLDADWKQ